MEIKISIKTIEGNATKLEYQLRPFIIGDKHKIHQILTSPKNDEVIWIIQGEIKTIMKIQRNIALFDTVTKTIFLNKQQKIRKAITKLADSPQDITKLQELLKNQTSVTILKEATLQELDEYHQTRWEKIKKIFKRIN
jgi:hypothetical protein